MYQLSIWYVENMPIILSTGRSSANSSPVRMLNWYGRSLPSCRPQRGSLISRSNKITYTLVGWRRFISKPFNTCDISDIHKAIPELKKGKTVLGRPYKANTISDFLKVLKQFFSWMIKNRHCKIKLDKIQDLKAPGERSHDNNRTRPTDS